MIRVFSENCLQCIPSKCSSSTLCPSNRCMTYRYCWTTYWLCIYINVRVFTCITLYTSTYIYTKRTKTLPIITNPPSSGTPGVKPKDKLRPEALGPAVMKSSKSKAERQRALRNTPKINGWNSKVMEVFCCSDDCSGFQGWVTFFGFIR